VNPNGPQTERVVRAMQEAGRVKRVKLEVLKAATENEIDSVSPPLPDCKLARSSREPIHSFSIGAIKSLSWRLAMPSQRSMSCARSSRRVD
jgi:hypothetical protein